MDNTYILIGFGILALGALLYLFYKQTKQEEDQPDLIPNEIPTNQEESDSYYEDSEVYSE